MQARKAIRDKLANEHEFVEVFSARKIILLV